MFGFRIDKKWVDFHISLHYQRESVHREMIWWRGNRVWPRSLPSIQRDNSPLETRSIPFNSEFERQETAKDGKAALQSDYKYQNLNAKVNQNVDVRRIASI